MAIPIATNNTCDIYRTLNAPPANPDVAGVPCYLKPDWVQGQRSGERPNADKLTWTHIMLVSSTTDIRDCYVGVENLSIQDTVWVPDKNGTSFKVTFVELVNRGMASVHKKVYLDRNTPPWPTDNV